MKTILNSAGWKSDLAILLNLAKKPEMYTKAVTRREVEDWSWLRRLKPSLLIRYCESKFSNEGFGQMNSEFKKSFLKELRRLRNKSLKKSI